MLIIAVSAHALALLFIDLHSAAIYTSAIKSNDINSLEIYINLHI